MDQAVPHPGRSMNPHIRHFLVLLGKVLLVVVLSTAAGWTWFYLLFQTGILGFVLIKPAVVIVLGVLAGFSSRFILIRNTRMLRFLTAIVALFIGSIFLSYGSTGLVGFSISRSAIPAVNWSGIWQLTLGGLMAAGALAAWRKTDLAETVPAQPAAIAPVPMAEQPLIPEVTIPEQLPEPKTVKTRKKTPSTRAGAAKKKPARQSKSAGSTEGKPKSASKDTRSIAEKTASIKNKLVEAARSLNRADVSSATDPVMKVRVPDRSRVKQQRFDPTSTNTRPHRARRPKISLVGAEEHRCPYCLEEVDPNDPAGVVVCQVCHSYHHKSCWDITGTCQVPHSQA
jgi:hypothetical protein